MVADVEIDFNGGLPRQSSDNSCARKDTAMQKNERGGVENVETVVEILKHVFV